MSHRILVVDDDPSVLNLLLDYLNRRLGYEVETVENGKTGIELAMENPFDLVILDVNVPGATGPEIYTRLRSIEPETEAIFITGDVHFETTDDFIRFSLPSERVFNKPIDLAALTKVIVGILGPPRN